MAVAVLLTASCAKEDISSSIGGGEVEVTFSANLPELGSRAYGTGEQVNKLRYFVYDGNTLLTELSGEQSISVNAPATVTVALLKGMTYNIVFWADYNSLYSYDSATKSISVDYANVDANDEKRDAFYKYVASFDPATARPEDTNIVLTRPFAQLNTISTDNLADLGKSGVNLTTSTITLDTYSTLNLATGEVDGLATKTLKAADVLADGLLSMNYLLAPAGGYTTEVALTINNNKSINFGNKFNYVPLKRNYRTNIIGKLLTSGTNFTVEIEAAFATAENTIFTAFEKGGEVTLTEDIEIARPLVVKSGVEAVLNLNGKTIKNNVDNKDTDVIIVEPGATLTINGEGNVEAVSGNDGYAIIAKGTVIINGGSYKSGYDADNLTNAVVYARGEGKVYINGGEFYSDNTARHTINKRDADRATTIIEICGGKFQNFNPQNNGAEGTGTNFLAAGYSVVANGEWYEVKKDMTVSTYDELVNAATNAQAGDTISISNDITLTDDVTLPAGVILNGNGKQINGTIIAGGDLTIKDHTKVTGFSASYYNRTITIGEGACLEVTETGRVSLAYGNVFNITGTITDANSADKTSIQPSLIVPGGVSITGGNDAELNIKNAYVKIGSTTSKNSSANGTFTINIENSIAEFTNQLTFSEPTSGKNPTFNINVKNSVLTTATKLILAAPNCNMVVDNSTINVTSYFRNSGNVELKNGSTLTGSTIQFGENGGHDGKTVVDNSTFTINANNTGEAYDGKNSGSITAKNGANVNVKYYKDLTIDVDATSTFTGTEVF